MHFYLIKWCIYDANVVVVNFIKNTDERKMFLSVITIGEIKSGIEKLKQTDKKEKLGHWLATDLIEKFNGKIISVDIDVMIKWGEINQHLKSKGKQIPVMDSLIGATCMAKNFTLIARNTKDFQNLQIQIINPFN
jgi:predicted nucleic acid-binding protein